MEYTIARIMFAKEVTGRSGIQHNIRFTTNETGEKSISGFFNNALKPGDKIEGDIVEKPGVNREGQPVIYHNFNFARKAAHATPSSDVVMIELRKIHGEVYAIRQEQVMIRQLLQKDGVIPAPEPYPTAPARTAFDDFDDEIRPEDIPFGN